jgi:hypothetical protein
MFFLISTERDMLVAYNQLAVTNTAFDFRPTCEVSNPPLAKLAISSGSPSTHSVKQLMDFTNSELSVPDVWAQSSRFRP